MTSTLRAVAEAQFATITRREEDAVDEKGTQLQITREKTARLKALRLSTAAGRANTISLPRKV
ncbi:MAG TPA: hypothetical protein VNS12_13500 [Pelagibacterium sp.]|uniref:hypothetical protein n=1 Tax=Pelagibacterium sp. TaxID=1967288 RepID=UPI002B6DE7ED|nr:hypothetical protein [Pelagibacterium sp.]HWJ89078.1 hypothetical protein [Pelagibacterium sp.]